MTQPDGNSEPVEIARHALRLNPAKRLLFGATSGAIWTAAFILLFRGLDGAAILALIAMGALFTFLAIVGVIPQRIKSGEHVVELYELLDRREREIDAAVEVMSEVQLKEAAVAVNHLEDRGQYRVRSRFDDFIVYENSAIGALQAARDEMGLSLKQQHVIGNKIWDAEVVLSNGHRCLVEIRVNPPRPAALHRTVDTLPTNEDCLLIIARDPKHSRAILQRYVEGGHIRDGAVEGPIRFAVAAPAIAAIKQSLISLGS